MPGASSKYSFRCPQAPWSLRPSCCRKETSRWLWSRGRPPIRPPGSSRRRSSSSAQNGSLSARRTASLEWARAEARHPPRLSHSGPHVRLTSGAGVWASTTGMAVVYTGLVLVHASDHAHNWVGQMHQFGMIFWMLLSIYALLLALTAQMDLAACVLVLLGMFFARMSLWSYESQVFIILAAPAFLALRFRF